MSTERNPLPRQSPCPCCVDECPEGCLNNGSPVACAVSECNCRGAAPDDGLCEGCWLYSK